MEKKYRIKEEAIKCIESDEEWDFCLCSKELQDDEDVTLAAIKKDWRSFGHASERLKKNSSFLERALNEGVNPWFLSNGNAMMDDFNIMKLAIKKDFDGEMIRWVQCKGAELKYLVAEALIKSGYVYGKVGAVALWGKMSNEMKDLFPGANGQNCYAKAQDYLHQLEQSRNVSGGCTEEDNIVW